MDYNQYYLNQINGTIPQSKWSVQKGFAYRGQPVQNGFGIVYRGQPLQNGYGLGSMFRKFFKWIIPIVKDHGVPLMKKGAISVRNEVLNSAANLAKDVIDGRNVQDAAKERYNQTVDTIKNNVEQTLKGEGINKKRTFDKSFIVLKKKKSPQKKKKRLDIFDNVAQY